MCPGVDVVIECVCVNPCRPPTTTGVDISIRVDRVSFNCWRSIWGSPEWSSWFAWCSQSTSVLCQSFKWLTMVISRHRQTSAVVLLLFKYSTLLHYNYRDTTSDAFYPQLACYHDVLPPLTFFHRILQFIQTTHGLRHWVCRNGSDAEVFFAEDKGNRNNWLYPHCLKALNPRGPYSK